MEKTRHRRWNLFILISASFHFALAYTLNTSSFLDLTAFSLGKERGPFQYRALTAWILLAVDRFVHIPSALASHLPPKMSNLHSFVILGIVFCSLLVGVYATRFSLERLTGDKATSRWWALLVIFMCYYHYLLDFGHPCCIPYQLPYDLPSMAFFSVLISLMIANRLPLLYLVFVFSYLNRESTDFFIVIFALYHSVSLSRRDLLSKRSLTLALELLGFGVIAIALRAFLHHLYPSPIILPGPRAGDFEIHVRDNIGYLLRPYYWASYLSMFGFSWIFLYLNWRNVPHPGIRRALWIGPISLACLYVVGILSEIRIFGELISLFVIAMTLLARRLWDDRTRRTEPQVSTGPTGADLIRPVQDCPPGRRRIDSGHRFAESEHYGRLNISR